MLVRLSFRQMDSGVPFPGVMQPLADPRPTEGGQLLPPYSNFALYAYEPDKYDYFVLGDLHGDVESFKALADEALRRTEKIPVLILLGDLIDRGPDSAACIRFLLSLALGGDKERERLRVLFVRGDHDEGLVCSDSDILSCVRPSEFADWFVPFGRIYTTEGALARAFARFAASSPAAILLSNGDLMAHGGVPHTDLQAKLVAGELTLWAPECAKDFVWARLWDHRDYPRKLPNRHTRTPAVGYEDFNDFFTVVNDILARESWAKDLKPVSRYFHGHEHVAGGYARAQCSKLPAYTLTSFDAAGFFGDERSHPGMLRLAAEPEYIRLNPKVETDVR